MSTGDNLKILAHIKEKGFGGFRVGTVRPSLSKSLSPDEFRQNYFDKRELTEFCRAEGIPTSGSKGDLNGRIEVYLRSGEIVKVEPVKRPTEPDSLTGLSLDKPVVNYKSDPKTRLFFKKHIPGFTGFSALVQKDLKRRLAEGETLIYRDLINLHKEFLQSKHRKDPEIVARVAHESCQFNQFQIDYKNDDSVGIKVHSVKEAWYLVRDSPGEKTFKRYRESIQEIRDNISK